VADRKTRFRSGAIPAIQQGGAAEKVEAPLTGCLRNKSQEDAFASTSGAIRPLCLTIRQLPANHSTDGQQAAAQQQQTARLRDYRARRN